MAVLTIIEVKHVMGQREPGPAFSWRCAEIFANPTSEEWSFSCGQLVSVLAEIEETHMRYIYYIYI